MNDHERVDSIAFARVEVFPRGPLAHVVHMALWKSWVSTGCALHSMLHLILPNDSGVLFIAIE